MVNKCPETLPEAVVFALMRPNFLRSDCGLAVLRFGVIGSIALACSNTTPPAAEIPQASTSNAGATSTATATPTTTSVSAEPATTTTSPSTHDTSSASLERVDNAASHALVSQSGDPLPQTDTLPDAQSPSFRRRLELLVAAVSANRPEVGLPAFFPQLAYAQVKAIKDPNKDWERRLVAAFSRNVAEYHKQLGADAEHTKLVRIEIPESRIKWMKPGAEGNKLGYHRVTRSKLILAKPDGKEISLEVTSLISWRGEWYVVHLHGFD